MVSFLLLRNKNPPHCLLKYSDGGENSGVPSPLSLSPDDDRCVVSSSVSTPLRFASRTEGISVSLAAYSR